MAQIINFVFERVENNEGEKLENHWVSATLSLVPIRCIGLRIVLHSPYETTYRTGLITWISLQYARTSIFLFYLQCQNSSSLFQHKTIWYGAKPSFNHYKNWNSEIMSLLLTDSSFYGGMINLTWHINLPLKTHCNKSIVKLVSFYIKMSFCMKNVKKLFKEI